MRIPGVRFVQGRNSYSDSDGRKYGIAIHNTSNDATAEGEASYATRRTDGVSSHFYVDSDSIIQSLDTNARAGHAGSGNGNQNAIAFEITGTNSKSRAWWLANVAWGELGRVLAVLCREYDIEPRRASVAEMKSNPKVRAFYGHDDMRRAWAGTTHTDPGGNFPWDHLFAAVKAALNGEDDDDMTPEQSKQLGEVHAWMKSTGWADSIRALALLKGEPAVYSLPGEKTRRTEPNRIAEALSRVEKQLAAVLTATGADADAVMAEIRRVAAVEAERDAQTAAELADLSDRLNEVDELVRRVGSGDLTAEQVVDELTRRLAS